MVSSDTGAFGNTEHPFIPLLPGSLCPGVVAPDRTLSMASIELSAYLY